MPRQETADPCLLGLIPVDIETPIYCSPRRDACFQLSQRDISVGKVFGNRARFRETGKGITSFVDWSESFSTGCER